MPLNISSGKFFSSSKTWFVCFFTVKRIMVDSWRSSPSPANYTYANPITIAYYENGSSHMALGEKSQSTTSNCVPSIFTSIPETIPPICSALRPSYSTVQELTLDNSPQLLSDSGISVSSYSPEAADTCRYQQYPVQNNMGQMPYFANPSCGQFYPQNASFLSYDPDVINYSTVRQNEALSLRSRSPTKRPTPFKIKKCRRPKRLASQ